MKLTTDACRVVLAKRPKPAWAIAAGRDRHGLWSEIEVEDRRTGEKVRQRLRWCPPGEFMMGSPPDEPGRFEDEGPPHTVVISHGFWLFDTPCPQALWQAVMGENPSRFTSPSRPVEQVSWHDAIGFLSELNQRVPGVGLSLPTEAQWEYACRAGTRGATYAGPMDILAEHDAPVLNDIAWYGGNCAVDFELPNGVDVSDWEGRQFAQPTEGGTHPVRAKAPNPWGLYDMLGNVLEWCADEQRRYEEIRRIDPLGPTGSNRRVVRGGAWGGPAGYVRAAYRGAFVPEVRNSYLGFRCARVQVEPGTELGTAPSTGPEDPA